MIKNNLENLDDWIKFVEWINYLSPWNLWIDHNDKSKGIKPHILDKLQELLTRQCQQTHEEFIVQERKSNKNK